MTGDEPTVEPAVDEPTAEPPTAEAGTADEPTSGSSTTGAPSGSASAATPDGEPSGDADAEEELAAEPVDLDIEVLLSERDQFKDIALRLQADFDNYRRRVSSQRSEEIDRATGRIVESLLPVLDACEAAFAHGVDGVEPIWSALIGVLQKQGLEALDLQGKPFDPTVADAVTHEPGEDETFDGPVVTDTLRTGYRWNGKILRPAMVRTKG